MRKTYLIILAVLIIAGIISLLFFLTTRIFKTSVLPLIPPIVDEPMDFLLQSLEIELVQHNPDVIDAFMPGITTEELERAEAILELTIHPEMQEMYRWHNGLADNKELFPGYGFWSLDEAVQTNQEFRKKGIFLFLPDAKNWLILFPDSAGDGFYYDPGRSYETGGIFYNIREAGYYRYFPSIRNLLKAIVECYQNGVYPQDESPNFELEESIMSKYGVESQVP